MDKLIIHRSHRALIFEVYLALSFSIFVLLLLSTIIAKLQLPAFLNTFITISLILLAILLIASIVLFIILEKRNLKTKTYIITQDTITSTTNIFGLKKRTYNVRGLTHMELSQNVVGKLLNYGTVTIYFMGGSFISIRNIPEPSEHLEKIQEIINKR